MTTSIETSNEINFNDSVYRFKFTQDVMNELTRFAKIHQFDNREDYKEAWKEWADTNEDMISNETRRLYELGYTDNVEKKMYKSARYYFRTKAQEKQDPQKRRNYIPMTQDILKSMDEHVNSYCRNESDPHSPAEGFDNFCENYKDIIRSEIQTLFNMGIEDHRLISAKLKKTYKNRHYQLTH